MECFFRSKIVKNVAVSAWSPTIQRGQPFCLLRCVAAQARHADSGHEDRCPSALAVLDTPAPAWRWNSALATIWLYMFDWVKGPKWQPASQAHQTPGPYWRHELIILSYLTSPTESVTQLLCTPNFLLSTMKMISGLLCGWNGIRSGDVSVLLGTQHSVSMSYYAYFLY